MVKDVTVESDVAVHVEIYLTTSACPKKTEISDRVTAAVTDVPGTGAVKVTLDVMNDEQRTELRKQLRGDAAEPVIPFAQPNDFFFCEAPPKMTVGEGDPEAILTHFVKGGHFVYTSGLRAFRFAIRKKPANLGPVLGLTDIMRDRVIAECDLALFQ